MQAEKKLMSRQMYLDQYKISESLKKGVERDPYRLRYHLQPPMGWLNDPNGLCQIGDEFHIYFQYTPFSPEGGTGLWGHMVTDDFIHYKEYEPAIYPDCVWDANGAYSGSAFEREGIYSFFYTGNVKYDDKQYDYITDGREQNVILTTSKDGFSFSPKKLIMTNDDFPADMSKHVRDPQVIQKNGMFYMFLGARDLSNRGSVLLLESIDLENWKYKLRFTTKETFGYMWECPNYVEIEGNQFLIVCPQGTNDQRDLGENVYQCGAFPLNYDFGSDSYEIGEFHPLDRGFDFYAPQVFVDHKGRSILIGWMGMPDSEYHNEPTVKNGWQHALTIPRELYLTPNQTLGQRPAEELKKLRKNKMTEVFKENFEVEVTSCYELDISFKQCTDFYLNIRENSILRYENGILQLNMETGICGRTNRRVTIKTIRNIKIMSDVSSLEIFVNDGEEVFTTRVYDSLHQLQCSMSGTNLAGELELVLFVNL